MVVVGFVVTVGANDDDVIVVVGGVCDDVVPSVAVVICIVVVTVEGKGVDFGSVVEVNEIVFLDVLGSV